MFAQMKSQRKEIRSNHPRNSKFKIYPLIFPILIPLIFPFLFAGIMVYIFEPPEPKVRYIEVNGQDCHIEYVKDKCNSHGGCSWHDRAVCP
jgi:hypothetical protein